MRHGLTFEVCVDSIESALAAEQAGADRVELCSDLLEGGLTPSFGMLRAAREAVRLKVMVMIRPRGGDFCYSDVEFQAMQHDVRMAREAGADGIVVGLLAPDGTVDAGRTAALVALARPLAVTFHRAFDMTRDPFEALDSLIGLAVDRVLTSGQEASVLEGVDLIAALVRRAGSRIVVMPGGGLTDRNIRKIVDATGVAEVHFACAAPSEGRMAFRNPRVFMGGTLRPPEYTRDIARADDIARVMAAVRP
jgi:copper homeostasis protein